MTILSTLLVDKFTVIPKKHNSDSGKRDFFATKKAEYFNKTINLTLKIVSDIN